MSEPLPPTDTPSPPIAPSDHAANGEDETSLARLADDGGPPPSEPEDNSLAPRADDPVHLPPQPPVLPPTPPVAAIAVDTLSLEQRVRRLEDALAQLQQQRGIETRIATHVPAARPANPPPPAPAAATAASAAMLFDVGKRLLGAASNAVTQAPPPSPAAAPPSGGSGVLWLLRDTWAEARAIVRMFLDPRYHLPRSARLVSLVLLAAILTSGFWLSWLPGMGIFLLGTLINKAVDLLLALLLFKWLGHEARRYRQSSPDLPPNLRL
jgi:hypothetical protein